MESDERVFVIIKNSSITILDASGDAYWTPDGVSTPISVWNDYTNHIGLNFEKIEAYVIDFSGGLQMVFSGNV